MFATDFGLVCSRNWKNQVEAENGAGEDGGAEAVRVLSAVESVQKAAPQGRRFLPQVSPYCQFKLG
jgi:hypothetical protein